MQKNNAVSTFYFIFLLIFAALAYYRIYLGVDLSDEAYNLAVPYRMALGDKPFLDDISPHQTSALLLFPIIKAYTSLFGTQFIVLFMRHIYLLFTLAIALLIRQLIRREMGEWPSLFISLFMVAFAPVGAIFFNYNRLAYFLFAAGCFLGVLRPQRLVWSGVLHGLSVLAYPFFAIPCAVFFLIQLLQLRGKILTKYVLGGSIPLLALAVIIWWVGIEHFLEMTWSLRDGIQGGGIGKILQIFMDIWKKIPFKGLLLIYLPVVWCLFRRRKQSSMLLLLIPLIPLAAITVPAPFTPSWYIILFSLAAPFLMLFVNKEDGFRRSIFFGIWIPAFVAGIVTATVSANGTVNFAIGVLPAALVSLILLNSLVRESLADRGTLIAPMLPLLLLALFMFFQYSFVYSEGGFPDLSARIESGPYAGLRTSPAKKHYLSSIMQDFDKFRSEGSRVLFFDSFPAGYLFSTMRPATNSVWLLPPESYNTGRDLTLSFYSDPTRLPDISVRLNQIYTFTGHVLELNYSVDDPLVDFVRNADPLTYHGEFCDIYYR